MRAIVAADPKDTLSSADSPRRPIAWTVEDSAELYQVNAWGKGYFCVNPAGHLVVRPDIASTTTIPNGSLSDAWTMTSKARIQSRAFAC